MPSRPHNSQRVPAASSASHSRPARKETQHPPAAPASVGAAKKIVYYCKEHSEEEISYYCFSCWANICPECAIHGRSPWK
jgi:hypothetical protein